MSIVLLSLAAALISYLLGSLNGAVIVSEVIFKKDVRSYGSGNAGLTNFMRAFGSGQALLVVLIDFLKCVIACYIGGLLLGLKGFLLEGRAMAGLFTILGHMFPVYFKFKGGKGIMTGAAMSLMLDWRIFLIILGIFFIFTALSKMVSLGSVCAAIGFPVSTALLLPGSRLVFTFTLITGLLVIFMHRGNLVRIAHGEERKLTIEQFKKR